MKRRIGFVANSSSGDYLIGRGSEEEEEEYDDEEEKEEEEFDYRDKVNIKYGRKDCEHFFVKRADCTEKDSSPLVCIKCGAFVDYKDIKYTKAEVELKIKVSGMEYSFFDNPYSKEKFKNGVELNKLNDYIIL